MFESEIARGDRRTQQRTKPLKRRGAKATVTGNRNRRARDGGGGPHRLNVARAWL